LGFLYAPDRIDDIMALNLHSKEQSLKQPISNLPSGGKPRRLNAEELLSSTFMCFQKERLGAEQHSTLQHVKTCLE
jgi:hypothetical protein